MSLIIEIGSRPKSIWQALQELWRARSLVYFMVARELRGRYRGTFLGRTWILLRPVVEILPYIVVFSVFLGVRPGPIPYVYYVLSGFAPWLLFRSCLSAAPGALSSSRGLIKKIYFPRLIVPLTKLGTALTDFLVLGATIVLASIPIGLLAVGNLWALPLFLLLLLGLSFGLGLVVTVVCTIRPDIAYGVPPALRTLLYLSPIVYPLSVVPEQFREIYMLNPITTAIGGIRWSLFGVDQPSVVAILSCVGFTLVMLLVGIYLFVRAERNLVDFL